MTYHLNNLLNVSFFPCQQGHQKAITAFTKGKDNTFYTGSYDGRIYILLFVSNHNSNYYIK